MFRQICERFGNAFHNMRRRAFQFRDDAAHFLHDFALRHVSGKLHVGFFERTMKAAHTVAMLAYVAALCLIQNVADVLGRVAQMLEWEIK